MCCLLIPVTSFETRFCAAVTSRRSRGFPTIFLSAVLIKARQYSNWLTEWHENTHQCDKYPKQQNQTQKKNPLWCLFGWLGHFLPESTAGEEFNLHQQQLGGNQYVLASLFGEFSGRPSSYTNNGPVTWRHFRFKPRETNESSKDNAYCSRWHVQIKSCQNVFGASALRGDFVIEGRSLRAAAAAR